MKGHPYTHHVYSVPPDITTLTTSANTKFTFIRPTLVGTKNLNENVPKPFYFGGGPKMWSESILWRRFCFGMVSTTSLSLSMRGRYRNEIFICRIEMATYFSTQEGEICKSRRAGALQ